MMKSVKKNSKKKGLWIPIEILEDKQLDSTNKILLSEIYSYLNNDKECYCSNGYFGNILGMTNGAASKRITQLQKLGYIRTKNKFENGACTGRFITRGTELRTTPPLPEQPKGISDTTINVVPEEPVGSSIEDIRVLPQELESISHGKPTNIITNTDIEIEIEVDKQKEKTSIIKNLNNQTANKSVSLNQYYQQQFDDSVNQLFDLSKLGPEILEFIDFNQIDDLKNKVGIEIFTQLEPVISKFKEASKKLGY